MVATLTSESAWINSGGGPSNYIPMPLWQTRLGLSNLTNGYRATPDIAFDASPNLE